ncbi:YraN family protein [Halotalea alkalilenta]|uniref:YraN family protein n=1 Tax=Halotalea alkalilenta TaxID=376489 RepID=UPI000487EBB1|nr:YraN family protein [Halotalea alkalilenta]
MTGTNRRADGQQMEALAAAHLVRAGLVEVARNQHARGGEIDLVMRDGDVLVFVEVRHRRSTRFGSALESVTETKRRRLRLAARVYLQRNRLSCACRFDVVGITGRAPDALRFDWIKAAFDG